MVQAGAAAVRPAVLVATLALIAMGLTACHQGDATIVFAGDIACETAPQTSGTSCRFGLGTTGTAGLVSWLNPDLIGAPGDLQYPNGSLAGYNARYHPAWGTFRAKTLPAPGNHEYNSAGAGYYDYWGSLAGVRDKGWYAKLVGEWLIVAINSEVGVDTTSEQYRWLDSVLKQNAARADPRDCILTFWHQPRWSSDSHHGSDTTYGALWSLLRAHHADVVVNGHAHNYERFGKQNASGIADAGGIREFISGGGGKSLYGFSTPIANSQVRIENFGVLRLQLHQASYGWAWYDLTRTVRDSGTAACNAGS